MQRQSDTPLRLISVYHPSYKAEEKRLPPYCTKLRAVPVVPFDKLLSIAFGVSEDDNLSTLASEVSTSTNFQDCLRTCLKCSDEDRRRILFNKLAHHILAEIDDKFSRQNSDAITVCDGTQFSLGSDKKLRPVFYPSSTNEAEVVPLFHWFELPSSVEHNCECQAFHAVESFQPPSSHGARFVDISHREFNEIGTKRQGDDFEEPPRKRQKNEETLAPRKLHVVARDHSSTFDMMCSDGVRMHTLSILISGEKLEVLFFNQSLTVVSTPVLENIIELANMHKKNKWVLNHLPEVLHCQVIRSQNRDFCARLSKYLKTDNDEFEDSNLTMLVTTEQLPVMALENSGNAIGVFRDVFKCYRWLYDKAKIMHRDIDIDNIMYRQQGGRICGVLSEHGLIRQVKSKKEDLNTSKCSLRETGTAPFMAFDLLEDYIHPEKPPTVHYYRHDLESLFYALIFFATGKDESPIKKEWCSERREWVLRCMKVSFFLSVPALTGGYVKFVPLFMGLQNMFLEGMRARLQHYHDALCAVNAGPIPEFVEETFGGCVTFDKFEAVLSSRVK